MTLKRSIRCPRRLVSGLNLSGYRWDGCLPVADLRAPPLEPGVRGAPVQRRFSHSFRFGSLALDVQTLIKRAVSAQGGPW